MFLSCTREQVYRADGDTIDAYSLEDLRILGRHKSDSSISSLCCDSVALFGTQGGGLYLLVTPSEKPHLLKSFGSPVTALFLKDSVLGVGTDSGRVCVMLLKNRDLVAIDERKHSAPILGIATNGVDIYVSDMLNRICVFPEHKIYDNFHTHIYYCRYLFSSESTLLYCKTKDAFAVCLEHVSSEPISRFFFNHTGSVLFIKESSRVAVYDFNSRAVVNEVFFVGDCVYDDGRNRLIVYENGEFRVFDGVVSADLLQRSMDEVFFKQNKIEERIVWSEGEHSDEEVVRTRRRPEKRAPKYEFVTGDSQNTTKESAGGKSGKRSKASHVSTDTHAYKQWKSKESSLQELFEQGSEHNASDAENTEPCPVRTVQAANSEVPAAEDVHKIFMPSAIRSGEGHLMRYSNTGYLISTSGEFFNTVELIYHDKSMKSVRIKDTSFCSLGTFSGDSVLLGSATSLHFYSKLFEWCYKSAEDVSLVGASSMFLCVVYEKRTLRIYRHSGLEVFNSDFDQVQSIFCSEESVLVLCGAKTLWEIQLHNFGCRKFDTLGKVDWIFASGGEIYYRSCGRRVYQLRGQLSLQVVETDSPPLCVSGDHLVVLSSTMRLYPEPVIEYFKIKMECRSNGPNVLNFCVLKRDEEQLRRVEGELADAGKAQMARDIRLVVEDAGAPAEAPQMHTQDMGGTDSSEEQPHYRETENIHWDGSGTANSSSTAKDAGCSFQVKTKRYNPFKK